MMLLFAWAIARNTRDEEGKSVGTSLLSKGILNELRDQVHTCEFPTLRFFVLYLMFFLVIIHHGLDCHQDEKAVFREMKLKLMVEEALKGTQKTGRKVSLQRLLVVNVLFFTGACPGSLGSSEAEYASSKLASIYSYFIFTHFSCLFRQQYPMLKDIKIHVLGCFIFKVKLNIKNFKALGRFTAGFSGRFSSGF